jgi:hypothetical protein
MIRSAAEKLIQRYGEDAPREAAQRAEELHSAGDEEGYALWSQIRGKVESLLQELPGGTQR